MSLLGRGDLGIRAALISSRQADKSIEAFGDGVRIGPPSTARGRRPFPGALRQPFERYSGPRPARPRTTSMVRANLAFDDRGIAHTGHEPQRSIWKLVRSSRLVGSLDGWLDTLGEPARALLAPAFPVGLFTA